MYTKKAASRRTPSSTFQVNGFSVESTNRFVTTAGRTMNSPTASSTPTIMEKPTSLEVSCSSSLSPECSAEMPNALIASTIVS